MLRFTFAARSSMATIGYHLGNNSLDSHRYHASNFFTRQIEIQCSDPLTHTHTLPWQACTHKGTPGSKMQERVSYWLQTMWDISRQLCSSSQHGKYCNVALSLFIPRCLFRAVFGFPAASSPFKHESRNSYIFCLYLCWPLTATNCTRAAAGSSGSGL